MVDEGVKITVRITNDVIQLMEDYMSEHMIENRSDFVRDAIRGYISSCKAPENPDGAVTVPLNPVVIQTLENMKAEGIITDTAAYIAGLVNNDVIPKEVMEESKARAFKAAQQSSRMM
jgi:metal-responsive CopG/Arc/MetJ family transcriptional regulator